ncbi:sugar transferase [Streptomyces blattellae]|uniref:sugar transferase n=1 Tax=Streptomyces blattellae TaxID=2569855 RepID=UPI0012B7A467|nr:sugar transferase [Streptomyces blattellae]
MEGVAPVLNGVDNPAATPQPTLIRALRPRCAGSRAKRMLDIVLSAVLLIVFLPLMMVVGLAVAVSSAGPVVFRQTRVGLGERPFTMLKFRTMRHNASVGLVDLLQADGHKLSLRTKPRHDPRITVVGRFLRKGSLDELPQLVNVLRGDMSLVGPRPCERVEHTTLSPEDQVKRVSVKPGMTGLWQVSGRSTITAENAIRLDLEYVDNWRLRLDLLILLRTLPAVLRTRHAW